MVLSTRSPWSRSRALLPSRRAAGFSLLEVLFAAVILLAALLGISTLFMRSMANNVEGRESSVASAFVRSQAEELQAIALEHPDVQVTAGSTKETKLAYWDDNAHSWEAAPPAGSPWTRTTDVQLFRIDDLKDEPPGHLPILNNPLDGATPVENVSMRQIRVEIDGQREAGTLGAERNIDVMTMRGF